MKKKIVVWITVLLALIALAVYIVIDNALYLNWSEYKVPSYPVGGFDNKLYYSFDPQTILVYPQQGKTDLFIPTSGESENMMRAAGSLPWRQDEYLKVWWIRLFRVENGSK